MRAAVEGFAPEGHVVPYCMSRRHGRQAVLPPRHHGLRLRAAQAPEGFDYQALFHGVDERVPVEALHFGVRVLDRFLRTA